MVTIEDQIKEVFIKSWEAFSNNFVVLILGAILAFLISLLIVPFPPMIVGFYMLCNNVAKGKKAQVSDIFKGFNYFFSSWGLIIVWALGVLVGLILLVIPGILLIILWQFAIAIFVIENKGIMKSLRKSYDIGKENFGFAVIFIILIMILNIIGGLARIGGILTVPFSTVAIIFAVQILTKSKRKK